MTAPRVSRAFACLRSATASCPNSSRRCPQCLRPFSSNSVFRQSSKRQLMTESAYRPNTFDLPPTPPRNAPVPSTSIAGGASQTKDTARPVPWREAGPLPTKQAIQESEQQAQQPRPVSAPETPLQPSQMPSTSQAVPRKRTFRPRKAAMILTPSAVTRLRELLDDPDPKLIRVGVKNKGCSGSAYHLEYVDKPGKFDDQVEQDGVKVLIDSKALIKVIGSEMDWVEDKLSARFTFKNPNITEQCGCGESFSTG